MEKELYILGGSGHALIVNELARLSGWVVKGYFDRQESKLFAKSIHYMGVESEGSIERCLENAVFFPAIGDNAIRARVAGFISQNGRKQTTLIHPKSIISSESEIDLSSMIGAGAIVNPFAKIGQGVIINSGAIIEHECQIGDFCHIAPGATILGNVEIGRNSFIGGNAVVKQGVKIGSVVIVGAGAVVLSNVPDKSIVVGNPAKLMK